MMTAIKILTVIAMVSTALRMLLESFLIFDKL
jgi:hypothetical protein